MNINIFSFEEFLKIHKNLKAKWLVYFLIDLDLDLFFFSFFYIYITFYGENFILNKFFWPISNEKSNIIH